MAWGTQCVDVPRSNHLVNGFGHHSPTGKLRLEISKPQAIHAGKCARGHLFSTSQHARKLNRRHTWNLGSVVICSCHMPSPCGMTVGCIDAIDPDHHPSSRRTQDIQRPSRRVEQTCQSGRLRHPSRRTQRSQHRQASLSHSNFKSRPKHDTLRHAVALWKKFEVRNITQRTLARVHAGEAQSLGIRPAQLRLPAPVHPHPNGLPAIFKHCGQSGLSPGCGLGRCDADVEGINLLPAITEVIDYRRDSAGTVLAPLIAVRLAARKLPAISPAKPQTKRRPSARSM
jgi:hypothetical protein